ncbi:MAG: hypothetical protein GQ529_11310, partial [Methyloprofundus sp.]|nr:hypothetical protein [Methyloprofundus sp.]
MNNNRINRVIAGAFFISTLAISNFSYADADSFKLESEIKKLQNEIKSLQQAQVQMKLELDKLNHYKSQFDYLNVAT